MLLITSSTFHLILDSFNGTSSLNSVIIELVDF